MNSQEKAMRLPSINRKYKILSIIFSLVAISFFTYSILVITPSYQAIIKDIEVNNKVEVSNNNITLVSNSFTEIIRFSKHLANKHNLKSISMNGQILRLDDSKSKFYYTIKDNYIAVKSNYILKPSNNTLTINFNNKSFNYKINLVYSTSSYGDLYNKDIWFVKPDSWITYGNDNILLSTSDNKVSSLAFRRKFENSVIISTDIVSLGQPINYAVRIGQGTSIFFGINDDKTIQIIQAKYNQGKKKDEITKQFAFKFIPKNVYRVTVSKNYDNYTINITNLETSKSQIFDYKDPSPDKNIKEVYSVIGLDLWKGSVGVIVKNITIRSEENL